MTGHAVTSAALRLHQIVTAEMAEEWSVDFGPVAGQTSSLQSLVIGLSTEDLAVVNGQIDPQGGQDKDVFEIGCMAQVWAKGETVEAVCAALDQCYGAMTRVGQALRGAPDLDGSISWGRILRHQAQWVTAQNGGTGALVLFPVTAWAFRPTGS